MPTGSRRSTARGPGRATQPDARWLTRHACSAFPDANLPLDFADRFFLHRAPPKKPPAPTIEDLQAELEANGEAADALKARIAELEAAAAKAAEAEKQAAATQAEIEKNEKIAADAQAKADELKAQLAKSHA